MGRRSSVSKELINAHIPEIRLSIPGGGYFILTAVSGPVLETRARPGREADQSLMLRMGGAVPLYCHTPSWGGA
jgi:hypothetical protein